MVSTSTGHTIEVAGARKVWGTIRTTTSLAVSTTLKRLTTVGHKLTVKRKSQAASEGGRKERWWFIIRGDEVDLDCLQLQWETIAIQTAWKLERVTYIPSPPLSSTSNDTLVSSPVVTIDAESIANPTVSLPGDNSPVPVPPVSPSPEPCGEKSAETSDN